jgi:thiol-disulfide isomerase/thioredoxin
MASEDAILLEFSSPHCAPCKAMQPVLSQIERLGTPIRHVDVVAEPHLAARYGVRTTPTFVVISGGKEVTRLVGMQSLDAVRAALEVDPSGTPVPTNARSAPGSIHNAIASPQTRLAPLGYSPPQAAPRETSQNDQQQFLALSAPAPRSEPMPSTTLADAIERAKAATVRLRVHDGHGYGAGTGTIVDTHGDEALILTCGHLFRETQGTGKIEVDLFVGGEVRTVAGQVIDYDADTRDIALVAIRPEVAVQPVQIADLSQPIQNGQTAFSFGCDRGDDPSRRDTRVTGINKYNQHLGVSNLEIAGAPIDGRSGGGLFDPAGRLIGVCNAADYKDDVGIYAGPGNIQWQLDRVGLSHLYQRQVPERIADASVASELAGMSLEAGNLPAVGPASASQVGLGGMEIAAPSALLATAVLPAAAGQTQAHTPHEVIVIIRDHNDPTASRVMTLSQPSAELLQLIQQQAR